VLRPPVKQVLHNLETFSYFYDQSCKGIITVRFSAKRTVWFNITTGTYILEKNKSFVLKYNHAPRIIPEGVVLHRRTYDKKLMLFCFNTSSYTIYYQLFSVVSGKTEGRINIPRNDPCSTSAKHKQPIMFKKNIVIICKRAQRRGYRGYAVTLYNTTKLSSGDFLLSGAQKILVSLPSDRLDEAYLADEGLLFTTWASKTLILTLCNMSNNHCQHIKTSVLNIDNIGRPNPLEYWDEKLQYLYCYYTNHKKINAITVVKVLCALNSIPILKTEEINVLNPNIRLPRANPPFAIEGGRVILTAVASQQISILLDVRFAYVHVLTQT
jgi:hypothetical protein